MVADRRPPSAGVGRSPVQLALVHKTVTLAATTRNPQISPGEQTLLLHRVLESRLFRRSHRLHDMLLFLGEEHLLRGRAAIREQEIGVAVFERRPDYDTSLDNIVRVNATELRKRLELYFATEGAAETLLMDIPRGGGYVPTFHRRVLPSTSPEPAHTDPSALAPDNPISLDAAEPQPTPVAAPVSIPPSPGPRIPQRPSSPPSAAPPSLTAGTSLALPQTLATLSLLLAILAAALLWQNHRLALRLEPWKAQPTLAAFWSGFFSDGHETDIITADTSLALEEDLLHHQVSLEEYLSNSYRSTSPPPAEPQDLREIVDLLRTRNNGSIGDFEVARRILALDPYSTTLHFGSARDFLPAAVRSNNLILIGSRASNPWVDLFRDKLNFYLDFHPDAHRSFVVNRHPRPGEQPTYEAVSAADQTTVFSVVALLSNLDPQRPALLIAGTDSQATEAAGEFVTSLDGLQALESRLAGHTHFEVLLRSSRMAGATLQTEIVAVRTS